MTMKPQFGLQGLRHLALRVRDMVKARSFYEGLLGMKVVWEPDPENVYLSSGCDNLALHQIPKEQIDQFKPGTGQTMDHFGFIVESPDAVRGIFQVMQQAGTPIVKPLKTHRDESVSFYMADPDGNVIQILYEPHISRKLIP
ncbi:MAG: VOC family protein [Nitrospira sp.]|nr:VOC family protein [Nitrospira sp.]